MKTAIYVTIFSILSHLTVAVQVTAAIDPASGLDRPFGLGGHTCKQYDDTGRLFIYTEGMPTPGVMLWLQQSNNGTKPNVPMPQELAATLPLIPDCLPGKHHAAASSH